MEILSALLGTTIIPAFRDIVVFKKYPVCIKYRIRICENNFLFSSEKREQSVNKREQSGNAGKKKRE
jgi:hypothetical protein